MRWHTLVSGIRQDVVCIWPYTHIFFWFNSSFRKWRIITLSVQLPEHYTLYDIPYICKIISENAFQWILLWSLKPAQSFWNLLCLYSLWNWIHHAGSQERSLVYEKVAQTTFFSIVRQSVGAVIIWNVGVPLVVRYYFMEKEDFGCCEKITLLALDMQRCYKKTLYPLFVRKSINPAYHSRGKTCPLRRLPASGNTTCYLIQFTNRNKEDESPSSLTTRPSRRRWRKYTPRIKKNDSLEILERWTTTWGL